MKLEMLPAVSEANRQAQLTWNSRARGHRSLDDLRLLNRGEFYRTIAARAGTARMILGFRASSTSRPSAASTSCPVMGRDGR